MNNYYLRVIVGASTTFDVTIVADGFSMHDCGVYQFWQKDDNDRIFTVANYPIERTIIESIEYGLG